MPILTVAHPTVGPGPCTLLLLPQPPQGTLRSQDMRPGPRLQAIPLAGRPLLDTQAPRRRTLVSSMVALVAATTTQHMGRLQAPMEVHRPQAFLTPSLLSHGDLA